MAARLAALLAILALAALPAALLGGGAQVSAGAASPERGAARGSVAGILVLAVDKFAVEDLTEFPHETGPLREAAAAAAVGLMNVRTAAGADSGSGYLSLGAGGRAAAGAWSGRTFLVTERFQDRPAGDVYASLTGRAPGGEAVNLGIGELMAGGDRGGAAPGALGEALRRAGIPAVVIGTGDTGEERLRHAALIAMSAAGTVERAHFGAELLTPDPAWPTRVRTDYAELARALRAALTEPAFVVVDLADLARLEGVAELLAPEQGLALRREALGRISAFVRDAVELAGRQSAPWAVYLVAPSPARAFGRQGILTTPVVRWHPSQPAGLLTSATTRRAGIVANADFLPSVLAELGVEPPPASGGRPWQVAAHPEPLAALTTQYRAIREVHLQRLPVIQPYFFLVLGVIGTGALLTLGLRRGLLAWSEGRDRLWRALLGAMAAFPALLLILPAFPPGPLAVTWMRLIAALVLVALLNHFVPPRTAWGNVGRAAVYTALLLPADLFRGAPLIQGSLLGYDPIAGSRYYGIGNEYMGTLIGAALVGIAYVLELRSAAPAPARRRSRPDGTALGAGRDPAERREALLPVAVLTALTLILAHPHLGINVGGAIAAGSAAVAAHVLRRGQPFSWRQAAAGILVLALLLGGVALADYALLSAESSHLGRTVALLAGSGTDPLWDLFARKVAVNVKLIRLTIWSRVTLLSLGLLAAVLLVPNWLSRALCRAHASLVRMARVALVSAIVALAANDSGIVAAATLLLWPVLACLSLAPGLAARLGPSGTAGETPGDPRGAPGGDGPRKGRTAAPATGP